MTKAAGTPRLRTNPFDASHRAAGAELGVAEHRRVRRLRRVIQDVWLSEDYLVALARQLTQLFPESGVTVYTRPTQGPIVDLVHDLTGPVSRSWVTSTAVAWVERNHRYLLQGKDPFANRPVQTRVLFRGLSEVLEDFRDSVLRPYGAFFQLRTAIYDRQDRFVAYCGFLRPHPHGEFSPPERAMFDALAPVLADGFTIMRLIGERPSSSAQLAVGLDLFDEPACLVGESGAALFANAAARAAFAKMPLWLRDVPRTGRAPRSLGKVARLELDGRPVWLVVARAPARQGPAVVGRGVLTALPPSLTATAELLVAGLSDKEIAERTGYGLSTVRTYVVRIFRRLGVHSRSELTARWAAGRGRADVE